MLISRKVPIALFLNKHSYTSVKNYNNKKFTQNSIFGAF